MLAVIFIVEIVLVISGFLDSEKDVLADIWLSHIDVSLFIQTVSNVHEQSDQPGHKLKLFYLVNIELPYLHSDVVD